MESIKIGNQEFVIKSSAYTQFAYKNETGRNFLKDLSKLIDFNSNKPDLKSSLDMLDEFNDLLLSVTFVMIKEANENQVTSYDNFLKSIDVMYDNTDWPTKVILLACKPLSGQLQTNQK